MKVIFILLFASKIVYGQIDTITSTFTYSREIDLNSIEQFEFYKSIADSMNNYGKDYVSDHGIDHIPLYDKRFHPIITRMIGQPLLNIYSINDLTDPFSENKINVSYFKESSYLTSNKSIFYNSNRAFDSNLSTAWIENHKEYGTGEFIQCATKDKSISGLMIYNGYFKSYELWETNSRVKHLKIYYNNTPKYVLKLNDTMEIQYFFFPRYSLRQKENEILEIKLEIIDVYPGSKYKDTAISEIVFLK